MSKSKIEWTDETWNVTTGCSRVSSGCDNCYAVAMTKRLAANPYTEEKYSGLINEGKNHFNGRIKLHEDELKKPLHWRKPRMVFVNSMSDLFHPEVPFFFIDEVFARMGLAWKHTFQVLTKRPERMSEYLKCKDPKTGSSTTQRIVSIAYSLLGGMPKYQHNQHFYNWPLKNVWLGASIENQETANERIPHLLNCPAAVRFLSCEPLLGELNLKALRTTEFDVREGYSQPVYYSALEKGVVVKNKIDWVIVGGESGPNARPMHPDWLISLRNQCREVGVSFFFKQWGAYSPELQPGDQPDIVTPNGHIKSLDGSNIPVGSTAMWKVGKKKAGRLLFEKEWNQMPEAQ